jgi:copper(I)-binding protein
MVRRSVGQRAALTALLLLLVGCVVTGCVHYPTIIDIGGTNLRTANGRAVRQEGATVVVFEVISTGKYGDVITAVTTPLAKQAQLVNGTGAPVPRLEVPGATTMKFTADGPHVLLGDLQRPLTPGETFIVTLVFEKSGGIGVVTVVE